MRILFAGGGTAGHINPAVAVANFVKEKEPESEFLFVGSEEGMEKTLVPRLGFDIRFIKIHGFKRSLSLKNIKIAAEIIIGVRKAKKYIKAFKPDVVMGTGGYVSGPVLMAAAKLKIPTIIHESNAFPGVTVRMASKFVDVVALGMEDAAKYLENKSKIVITGNPIRPAILTGNKTDARKKLGLDERKTILIFGGSLGAEKINKAAAQWICSVADSRKYQILMSTGKNNHFETVMGYFKDKGIDLKDYPEIRISEYIYDMDMALNAADLIVARSGSSVSEMTALGKAAILIPSPYVAGHHQEHNARAVERSGGAVVITEEDLTEETLSKAAEAILTDDARLLTMSEGSKRIGILDATNKIYDILKNLTEK